MEEVVARATAVERRDISHAIVQTEMRTAVTRGSATTATSLDICLATVRTPTDARTRALWNASGERLPLHVIYTIVIICSVAAIILSKSQFYSKYHGRWKNDIFPVGMRSSTISTLFTSSV